jgi:hypothetical protein
VLKTIIVPRQARDKHMKSYLRTRRFAQELDSAAGALMAGVKAAGAANNTITFFTSDKCEQ